MAQTQITPRLWGDPAVTLPADHQSLAILLDLVDPERLRQSLVGRRREARLDEAGAGNTWDSVCIMRAM